MGHNKRVVIDTLTGEKIDVSNMSAEEQFKMGIRPERLYKEGCIVESLFVYFESLGFNKKQSEEFILGFLDILFQHTNEGAN